MKPFTRAGRQTLVYLIFAGSGPALTVFVWWLAEKALAFRLFATFTELARIVAASLLVVVIGLAMFVSIRAIKVGRDGIEANGGENGA